MCDLRLAPEEWRVNMITSIHGLKWKTEILKVFLKEGGLRMKENDGGH
jgi:hypothetical protein